MSPAHDAFIAKAREILPPDALLTQREDCAPYGSDWSRTPANPGPVCLPSTVEQVARILAACSELKMPVVPSGGRTGLVGGAVAARGEVVLSLTRMNKMEPVDTIARTVRVQAG